MENSTKYKVAVKCCTYNQAQYITDALNGFVMQETDFPFVCCIIDDASTDGEQEVIRKYVAENFDLSEPDVAYEKETDDAYITYARHKSNKNCFFAVLYLKRNLYHDNQKKDDLVSEWMDDAEYIALCEGDDYWINESKIKIQTEFLDKNDDYFACATRFLKFNQLENKVIGIGGKNTETIREMLGRDVCIGTATFICSANIFAEYKRDVKPESHNWLMGDKPLFLYFGYRGRVKTLDTTSATYRILSNSASHSSDINLQLERARNTIDIYHYFAMRYMNEDEKLYRKIEGGYLYRAFHIFHKEGLPLRKDIYRTIMHYKGGYWKLYLVKIFLICPFLYNIVYFFVDIKYKIEKGIA